jgi:SAM-dependent methyltransferase
MVETNATVFDDLELNFQPFLPADKGAAVLEVGSGEGRVLSFLKSIGYTDVLGVERDEKMVRFARERTGGPVEQVSDLPRFLAASKDRFDLVIAKDVIYYFPKSEVPAYLSAILGALKPGGSLIVEAINGATLTSSYIFHKEVALREMLEAAGFKIERVFGQIPPAGRLKRRVFNLVQRLWFKVLALVYLLERGASEENPRIFSQKFIVVARRSLNWPP